MQLALIDKSVTTVETPQGKMTLSRLFIPIFVEQLLMNMMGTVNTLVLGRYSDDAVAAVGAANQVIGFVFSFYAVVSGGASIVISHRLGEKDENAASETAIASVIAAFLLSILGTTLLYLSAGIIMAHLNLTGEVLNMATNYFRIVIGFSCFQSVILALSAILRSYGHPREAVSVSIFMNFVNAVLNYLVVFRPIDIPLKNAEGIAWANVIAHAFALVHMIIVFGRSGVKILPEGKERIFSADNMIRYIKSLKQILHVGVPGGISNLSYSFSQVVSTSILAALGTVALTTKIYVASIVFYVYVVGFSLGMAVSIMMGWMTGAKDYDRAYKLNQSALRIAVLINLCMSVLIFIFYRQVMGFFTQNEEIIAMSFGIFFIDIFVEIGRALNHVEGNSLRGAGDVMLPMIISIISCWLVSIFASYVLGIWFGLGLYGCWIAFMMDELFRGSLFYIRFRSKKWMKAKV